jgi:hypothetical protein
MQKPLVLMFILAILVTVNLVFCIMQVRAMSRLEATIASFVNEDQEIAAKFKALELAHTNDIGENWLKQ